MKVDDVMKVWRKGITSDLPQSFFVKQTPYETNNKKIPSIIYNQPTDKTKNKTLADYLITNGNCYLDRKKSYSFFRT
jgi:hypothetical protein